MGWEGFGEVRELAASLQKNSARVGQDGSKVVRRHAKKLRDDMKTNAPVDTGALRNSISISYFGDGRSKRSGATVGPETDHDLYAEYGTARMAPRPYAEPARAKVEPGFTRDIEAIGGVDL